MHATFCCWMGHFYGWINEHKCDTDPILSSRWLGCSHHRTFRACILHLYSMLVVQGSQHCDGNLCFHTQHLLNCWYGVLSHCYCWIPLPIWKFISGWLCSTWSQPYCRVMLSGGVICLIFRTVVLMLWPFYQPKIARAGQNVTIIGMKKDYGYHPLLPASSLTEEHIENTEHAKKRRPFNLWSTSCYVVMWDVMTAWASITLCIVLIWLYLPI